MATVMTNTEFVRRLEDAATNHKTLYVRGCFGAPMTAANKKRYTFNNDYNRDPKRTAMINAASADTFGFDCACLVKGILWGWCADKNKVYGGATYKSNGVPDINANSMITVCSDISTDFSKLVPGEAVWVKGHIGVYIGDGLAVECTPRWANKVQITACNCSKSGYNRRNWKKHGKLPYIEYIEASVNPYAPDPQPAPTTFMQGDLVKIIGTTYYGGKSIPSWVKAKNWYVRSVDGARVIIDKSEDGKNAICSPVNAADLKLLSRASDLIDRLAREVIRGLWGNGSERKRRLTAAGYDYQAVQDRVNELLK